MSTPDLKSESGYLIRNGQVVDGTGAAAYAGDIRIRDGVISEIGNGLAAADGETVFDASGCIVSPGFIDHHTHYDGAAFWAPDLAPGPGYGVTTIVMGNCGFTVAPLAQTHDYEDAVDILCFVEDLPKELFEQVPWGWTKWSEYQNVLKTAKLPANFGSFVGHLAIRYAVMGGEAARTRAATAAEIEQMVAHLEDALNAGAMGMSTNLFDHDKSNRPVPPLLADDEELVALFKTVARHPGATVQMVLDQFVRMTAPETMKRIERITRGIDVRVQWVGVPTAMYQKEIGIQEPLYEIHKMFEREGRDFWTGFIHYPITATLALTPDAELTYSSEPVWREVAVTKEDAEKTRLLTDPEWRARARESMDRCPSKMSFFGNPRGALLDNSANGTGPVDIRLGEYADTLGVHPSDALAEWFLANGYESTLTAAPWTTDEEMVVRLIRDRQSVAGISDAGAHLQTVCSDGINMELITRYARDKGLLTLEEAVHAQTGKVANFLGIQDRGTLSPGKRADIVVFNLDEVECRKKRKIWDVPKKGDRPGWRWTRDPAPMRLTLVNGVPTFVGGEQTNARPGEMITPGASSADIDDTTQSGRVLQPG